MATTNKILTANDAQIASSAGDLYVVPSATTCLLKSILLHNTNTTTETVLLYIANNGTGGSANLFWNITIIANETLPIDLPFPIPLDTGAKLRGATTTASKVNIIACGQENA